MKSSLSLSYKVFPELSELPQDLARSRFEELARDFYHSTAGIKAVAVLLGSGLIGLAAGLPFGIVAASVGAGAGIFAGSFAFNVIMEKAICSKLEAFASDAQPAASPELPQSTPRHSFAVLTDEERAIRREKQAAYLAKRRGKAGPGVGTSARHDERADPRATGANQ
jgi:hypothetical protein